MVHVHVSRHEKILASDLLRVVLDSWLQGPRVHLQDLLVHRDLAVAPQPRALRWPRCHCCAHLARHVVDHVHGHDLGLVRGLHGCGHRPPVEGVRSSTAGRRGAVVDRRSRGLIRLLLLLQSLEPKCCVKKIVLCLLPYHAMPANMPCHAYYHAMPCLLPCHAMPCLLPCYAMRPIVLRASMPRHAHYHAMPCSLPHHAVAVAIQHGRAPPPGLDVRGGARMLQ